MRIYEDLRVVQQRLAVLQAIAVMLVVGLAVLAASVVDGLLVPWLASVFAIEVTPLGPLALAARACANALAGGLLFAAAERRLSRSLS